MRAYRRRISLDIRVNNRICLSGKSRQDCLHSVNIDILLLYITIRSIFKSVTVFHRDILSLHMFLNTKILHCRRWFPSYDFNPLHLLVQLVSHWTQRLGTGTTRWWGKNAVTSSTPGGRQVGICSFLLFFLIFLPF